MPGAAPSRERSRTAARKATAAAVPRRSRGGSASKRSQETGGRRGLAGYLQQSQTPLASLWFVLPLLVLHEWGVQSYATLAGEGIQYRNVAFTMVTQFLASCGATGRYLPALAVVAILVSWHIARRDRWVFDTPLLVLLGSMFLESLALAIPLVGVYFMFASSGVSVMAAGEWKLMASLYLGAGVYEELVFRLGAFAVLSFLLLDVCGVSRGRGVALVVGLSALGFAGYHLWGAAQYPYPALVFVALRGIYYGIIFHSRGFGISVGVHTAYDLIFLLVREVETGGLKLFSSPEIGRSL